MLTDLCLLSQAGKKPPATPASSTARIAINDVPVHRCWHYVPRRVSSSLKRIVHEGTFVADLVPARADVAACRRDRGRVAAVAAGGGGDPACRCGGVPFVFHVQDLQPDAAVGLGMLKKNAFTRLLYRLEAFAYRHAARVSGISLGMLRAFAATKGVPTEKRVWFPNGVAPGGRRRCLPEPGRWRAKNGFARGRFSGGLRG